MSQGVKREVLRENLALAKEAISGNAKDLSRNLPEKVDIFGRNLPHKMDSFGRKIPMRMDNLGRSVKGKTAKISRKSAEKIDVLGRNISEKSSVFGRKMKTVLASLDSEGGPFSPSPEHSQYSPGPSSAGPSYGLTGPSEFTFDFQSYKQLERQHSNTSVGSTCSSPGSFHNKDYSSNTASHSNKLRMHSMPMSEYALQSSAGESGYVSSVSAHSQGGGDVQVSGGTDSLLADTEGAVSTSSASDSDSSDSEYGPDADYAYGKDEKADIADEPSSSLQPVLQLQPSLGMLL